MKNKIIVIEGTDASGKNTQSKLLQSRLEKAGYNIHQISFPNYESATGKIVAGPYLGRDGFGKSNFLEGAVNVNPKVAGLYFSADRLYAKPMILDNLSKGNLVIDRYVESNMAHQGGKLSSKKDRIKTYKWFEKLEYGLLKLPKPNIRVLLYMPREYAKQLLKDRQSQKDEHELNEDYLKLAEISYLEVAKKMKYKIVNCVKNGKIRTIEDINNELYNYVTRKLKK